MPVTVNQTLTSITVSPSSPVNLNAAQAQQFTATGLDQFNTALANQPTFAWSSAVGTISSSGLLTASNSSVSGKVTASSGGTSGSTHGDGHGPPADGEQRDGNPQSCHGQHHDALGDGGGQRHGRWEPELHLGGHGTPPAPVTFSPNGSNAASSTTATFSKAGSYTFKVTITDPGGQTATASVPVTVDVAPQVVGVYVSGSAWSTANPSTDLYSALAAAGAGSTLGYELASGGGQLSNANVPGWVNLDTISIVFSEPVSGVTASSLLLADSSNNGGPSSGVSVSSESNASTTVATFQLSGPLPSNKYFLNLAAAGISDAAGTPLDGAWTTGVSTFAAGSGDGSPGSNFVYRFNVLAGDVNGDGKVSAADVNVMRNQPLSLTDNSTNWRYDINGAGKVSAADVNIIRSQPLAAIAAFPEPNLPGSSGGAVPAIADNPSNSIAVTAGTPIVNTRPQSPQAQVSQSARAGPSSPVRP